MLAQCLSWTSFPILELREVCSPRKCDAFTRSGETVSQLLLDPQDDLVDWS